MGVSKGFWDVLKPVARMESLDSLRGKLLAIDLSFWIIQLLSRVKGIPLRKPHIRLLFFRTIHLVARIGAFPVFVADGEPPPLKLQVRLNRFSRISGVPLNTLVGETNCKMARNGLFTDSIAECVELLELLGLPVLRAKHEAEGLCAELQKQGLVDACVTPDSDAFLYGAEQVIKILQADLKDPRVESYMMSDIESFLGLHREHLVALALLAGCDYNVAGVPGIGCQNALRLIKAVPKQQIFDRLREWGAGRFACAPEGGGLINADAELEGRKEGGMFGDKEDVILKKEPHCSSCGHPGPKNMHKKLGCEGCRTADDSSDQLGCRPKMPGFKCTCQFCTRNEAMKKLAKHEGWKLKVCHKIFETRGFPNENIIEIFMKPEHDTLSGDIKPSLAWKPPRIEALEGFLRVHLLWDKAYVRRKLLPLLSFHCLKDTAATRNLGTLGWIAPSINGIYVPHSIQRIKILFSKPLFRVRWSRSRTADTQEDWLCLKSLSSIQDRKMDDDLDIMVSDIQTENLDNNLLFTTDEDMMLVKEAYPDLVSRFEQEQDMRKSKRKEKTRRKVLVEDLSGKQLRITSFFQSRKGGACIHEAKEISLVDEAQGTLCNEKTKLLHSLEREKEIEPLVKEEAADRIHVENTVVKQDRFACQITRAAHVLKDIHGGEDQSEYKYRHIAATEIVLRADDGKSNCMRNSRGELEPICIDEATVETDNKLEVVLIEGVQTGNTYACKASRVGNHSPGSQTYRKCFSSNSKCLPQDGLLPENVADADTTPPLRCWRELSEAKTVDTTDLSTFRPCTKRVLFS